MKLFKKEKEISDAAVREAEVTETLVEEPSQKKGIRIAKIVLNVVINILIVFVLIISILIATMALTSKNSGVSVVFGRSVHTIKSDSMSGGSPDGYEGGDFKEGDLVLGWPTSEDKIDEFEIGDIITFNDIDTDGSKRLIAHRIVDKIVGDDGRCRYQTQGDNRDISPVPDQESVDEYLRDFEVVTVIQDKDHSTTVWHGVGGFLDYIQTSQGFFLVVLVPMIIFFLYAILRVVMNTMNYKKAKAEESAEDAERNKQAEIDAAVKAALEAAGVSEKQEEPAADPVEEPEAEK